MHFLFKVQSVKVKSASPLLRYLSGFILLALLVSQSTNAQTGSDNQLIAQPGIAMHGNPRYPANFPYFGYVNPQAPKGGLLRLAVISNGFDTFNGFILKGVEAEGAREYVYDTLMVQSQDEPLSLYGLVAESIEVPDDRRWVVFNINSKARFADGVAITAEDVAFTFELLTTKGHPFYKSYYSDVKQFEVLSPARIKFTFKDTNNRELPLVLAQLPVLPKHYWLKHDFSKANLEIPLGSGPYRIAKVDAGRSVTYERRPDYWAKDLPVNVGRYNFDEIRYDYYGDETVALEAFKAGSYDFRAENIAKVWATAYTGPQFTSGRIIKEAIPHHLPVGMQSFLYNTRRPVFSDPSVRRALAFAFDFEWTNRQLFYNQYTRTLSYFDNSELAATGLPSAAELKLLEPWRKDLPEAVFTTAYSLPGTDGKSTLRDNLKQAVALLKAAGWEIREGKMTHLSSGRPLTFQLLINQKSFERVLLPFKQNLERLGIVMTTRLVDTNQYIERMRKFDFDMTIGSMPQSESPGNEQRNYWSSEAADIPGSRNYAGIKSPVVDALVDQVIQASDRESLVTATRALDRVLLWGHYVIPQWHLAVQRIAYWHQLKRPVVTPKSGVSLDTWWMEKTPE